MQGTVRAPYELIHFSSSLSLDTEKCTDSTTQLQSPAGKWLSRDWHPTAGLPQWQMPHISQVAENHPAAGEMHRKAPSVPLRLRGTEEPVLGEGWGASARLCCGLSHKLAVCLGQVPSVL